MPAPHSLAQGEINLRALWQAYRPRLWLVALACAIATTASFVVTDNLVPLYPASTTLMVEAGDARPPSVGDVYGVDTGSTEYLETQFAVVKSREIARRVVRNLGLANDPWFLEPRGGLHELFAKSRQVADAAALARAPGRREDAAVAALMERLVVTPVRKTRLVEISVVHPDPARAARITDAIAAAYIEDQLEVRLEVTRSAATWLSQRLAGLKQKLDDSERDLQQFLEVNRLVDLQGVQTVPAEELREISRQVAAASIKVTELSRRYGERHPQLVAAREELAEIERAHAAKLAEIQSIGRKQARLTQLQRGVEVNRYLYDAFLRRMNETAEAGNWEAPAARIVDHGTRALQPAWPRHGLVAGIVCLATFLLASFLVLARAALDHRVRLPQQLRQVGIPPLGVLPLVRAGRRVRDEYRETAGLGNVAFAEGVKTLRTNIILDDIVHRNSVIAVVSTLADEGKTTVVIALARSLAELQKVLVVDADLRRPSVHRALGVANSPGLVQCLGGQASFEECCRVVSDNLHVMPAGAVPPNPSELLSCARFPDFLAECRARGYQRILIDTPPVGVVSDAMIVGAQANGIVCVVQSGRMDAEALADVAGRLRERGSTLVGAVLNKVPESMLRREQYYYGYYGGYGSEYSQAPAKSRAGPGG